MIVEEENVEFLIEKIEIDHDKCSSEWNESRSIEHDLLNNILKYEGAFGSMPPQLKQVCLKGCKNTISILEQNGFYDSLVKKQFDENHLDLMLYAEQIMENVGSTVFNNDSIELLKSIRVTTLVDVDPNLTFSFINQLLKNNIININEFVYANMIRILENKAIYIDPANIISIVSLYFNQVTPSEYCDQLSYEGEIKIALLLLLCFIDDPSYVDTTFSAISGALNALNVSCIIPILVEHIPKIMSLYFSSDTTNYTAIMNFIIQMCAYSSTFTKYIIGYRNEIIRHIVNKEYRESVIMYITNLWSYLLCFDDGIDSFLYCLCILINDSEDINMTERILFLNYFEWIIETIGKNVFDYIFSGEVVVMNILANLIDISESLEDIYMCKAVHIITFILPGLLTNSVYVKEIPFEEIKELITSCISSENEYLNERALLLKEVINEFIE